MRAYRLQPPQGIANGFAALPLPTIVRWVLTGFLAGFVTGGGVIIELIAR